MNSYGYIYVVFIYSVIISSKFTILFQLSELIKLRNLHDLISLTIAGNPLCDLSHHRSYIIFHLRTLEQLDGQTITVNERAASSTRFAQGNLCKKFESSS